MRLSSAVSTVIVLFTVLAGWGRAQLAPAHSESPAAGGTPGSVTNGNTTIVFERASSSDIDTQPLLTWGNFAIEHPGIARALAYKPSLMSDPGYLKKHPELSSFFEAHPEVREAMAANPGNFNAIPPRPGE